MIPAYNRVADTVCCLNSLMPQKHSNFTVIVCDDGSTDGTYETITTRFADVVVLRGDGNLWWSGATNLGITYALSVCRKEDYILTLNNDLEVAAGYLRSLIDIHNRYPQSIIGSLALCIDKKEKIAFAGNNWNKFMARWRLNIPSGTPIQECKEDVLESDTLPGRGLLIPSHVFREIGLFDQKRFPQYGGDYDFSLRAKKAGYRLLVSCKSFIYSDVENRGYQSYLRDYSLRTYVLSYFSKKSPRNWACRFWFCVKHVPWIYVPIYLVLDEIRYSASFFRSWLAQTIKKVTGN